MIRRECELCDENYNHTIRFGEVPLIQPVIAEF
jgi:hypothetical protein